MTWTASFLSWEGTPVCFRKAVERTTGRFVAAAAASRERLFGFAERLVSCEKQMERGHLKQGFYPVAQAYQHKAPPSLLTRSVRLDKHTECRGVDKGNLT